MTNTCITCITCGSAFAERRAALGYKTCLNCGDKQAREVKRSNRTASLVDYNKTFYFGAAETCTIGWPGEE